MPVRRAFAKMFYQHQTDAARDLDANGECREKIFSAHGPLFAERQCSRQDRRARMNHRRMRVVIVFEVTEKAVCQRRVQRRGLKPLADDGGCRRTALGAQYIEQDINRWVEVGEKRDAGVVHQAALGQVHDVGGNLLGRKVQDEFCQCGFGLSHGDSPFLDSADTIIPLNMTVQA